MCPTVTLKSFQFVIYDCKTSPEWSHIYISPSKLESVHFISASMLNLNAQMNISTIPRHIAVDDSVNFKMFLIVCNSPASPHLHQELWPWINPVDSDCYKNGEDPFIFRHRGWQNSNTITTAIMNERDNLKINDFNPNINEAVLMI